MSRVATSVLLLLSSLALSGVRGVFLTDKAWSPSEELGFWDHGLEFEEQLADEFWLAWESDDETLWFAMAAPTEGWIGYGPSDTGSMIGSNPLVVHEQAGEWICSAMHARAMDFPIMNMDQNCELIEMNIANGEIFAKVSRPRLGCLPEDLHIYDENQRTIFAFGRSSILSYHADHRGLYFTNLVSGPIVEPPLDPELHVVEVRVGAFRMPAQRDVYFCSSVELEHDQKYHAYAFEPIIGHLPNPKMAHHMILWECQTGELNPDYPIGEARECSGAGGVPGCNRFWTGWAVGQGSEFFPEVAGLPFGPDNGFRYIFEAHYDNPQNLTFDEPGMGLRLHYSEILREHDAGVVMVASAFTSMEPDDELVDQWGECGCLTNPFTAEQPMMVIGMAWHMHTYGTKAYINLIRDGVEIEWPLSEHSPIGQKFWDFNLQGQHNLHKPFEVLPGDRMINHCIYDTSNAPGTIYFGEGTGDEMCTNFLVYYPRPGTLSTCGGIRYGGACDGPGFPISVTGPYEPLPPPPNNCNVNRTLPSRR